MRLWSDDVGIVSGVGLDFERLFGAWFNRNQINQRGLQARAPYTPRSWVDYTSADERTETPQFGSEHFQVMEPAIHDLPDAYRHALGLYLFRDTNTQYWNEVFEVQATFHPVIIWEIHAGAAIADNWGCVANILAQIDLFSINLAETSRLCQLTKPEQIVGKLLSAGVKAVALRTGSKGTIVADRYGTWHIPAYTVEVVDVTGAGNAFTGGFLVGFCEANADIVAAGQRGAVSASFMLQQYGPPHEINAITQEIAKATLRALTPVRIS